MYAAHLWTHISVSPARGTSELFATCSTEDIRLWHVSKPRELLRITVPNMTCNSLDFMADGRSIISGGAHTARASKHVHNVKLSV